MYLVVQRYTVTGIPLPGHRLPGAVLLSRLASCRALAKPRRWEPTTSEPNARDCVPPCDGRSAADTGCAQSNNRACRRRTSQERSRARATPHPKLQEDNMRMRRNVPPPPAWPWMQAARVPARLATCPPFHCTKGRGRKGAEVSYMSMCTCMYTHMYMYMLCVHAAYTPCPCPCLCPAACA